MLHATHTCNITFVKWSASWCSQVDVSGVLRVCMGVHVMERRQLRAGILVCVCECVCWRGMLQQIFLVVVDSASALAHIFSSIVESACNCACVGSTHIFVCVCVPLEEVMNTPASRGNWSAVQPLLPYCKCTFTVICTCVYVRSFSSDSIFAPSMRWRSSKCNCLLRPNWCSKIYNWNCSVGFIFMLEFMVRGLVALRQVNTN